jgi:hypothetical protein
VSRQDNLKLASRGSRVSDLRQFISNFSERPSVSSKKMGFTFWERCDVPNKYHEFYNNKLCYYLTYLYHYNGNCYFRGNQTDKQTIDDAYIDLVEKLQDKMQFFVAGEGIGIEANPTSNILISKYGRYCEHPIKKWFNLGLTYDETELKKCPQLFVSINTDDQGIFYTCLENEYALLALALHKEMTDENMPKYPDAMIYDWLDRIRQNGMDQSFYENHLKNNSSKYKQL